MLPSLQYSLYFIVLLVYNLQYIILCINDLSIKNMHIMLYNKYMILIGIGIVMELENLLYIGNSVRVFRAL